MSSSDLETLEYLFIKEPETTVFAIQLEPKDEGQKIPKGHHPDNSKESAKTASASPSSTARAAHNEINFPSGHLPMASYFTQIPEGEPVIQRDPTTTILRGVTQIMVIKN